MKITQKSIDLLGEIVSNGVQTFHHHYHILYDIADSINKKEIKYVEIGCYAGGSACLMLQRKETNVRLIIIKIILCVIHRGQGSS